MTSRQLGAEGGGRSEGERKNLEGCKWKGPGQMSSPRNKQDSRDMRASRRDGEETEESATIT